MELYYITKVIDSYQNHFVIVHVNSEHHLHGVYKNLDCVVIPTTLSMKHIYHNANCNVGSVIYLNMHNSPYTRFLVIDTFGVYYTVDNQRIPRPVFIPFTGVQ